MPIGTCKLCLRMLVELIDSHLLPKAGYRLLREDGGRPTILRDVMLAKDEQIHDYVLCPECEGRLNDHGERWVLAHCYRSDERFLLHDLLTSATPLRSNDRMRIYAAANIPAIDVSKLAYFGCSIFWRASVHQWKTGKDPLQAPTLSDKHREALRVYLMGGEFSTEAVLHLAVLNGTQMLGCFSTPQGSMNSGCQQVTFWYFGLQFTLWLGDSIPSGIRQVAFFPSQQNLIALTSIADEALTREALDRMAQTKAIDN